MLLPIYKGKPLILNNDAGSGKIPLMCGEVAPILGSYIPTQEKSEWVANIN